MPKDWSDKIVIANLSDEPELTEDLAQLLASTRESSDKHVVLDMSGVSYLNSSHLAQLLRLRRQVTENGCQLHICSVRDPVWSVMMITGLDKVFDFYEDKVTAITSLQLEDQRREASGG